VRRFVVVSLKALINVVKWGEGMFAFAKDGSTFGIMQGDVKLVELIQKSMVVKKNIGPPFATHLSGNADGFAVRHLC
jgi:hypothetical protein